MHASLEPALVVHDRPVTGDGLKWRDNKIKAVSRDTRQVIGCTSFFRETTAMPRETAGVWNG